MWSQFDAQTRTSTYAALSPGPGVPFGRARPAHARRHDRDQRTGRGFQPVSGQAVAIVPIIQGNSGGFVSAVQTP